MDVMKLPLNVRYLLSMCQSVSACPPSISVQVHPDEEPNKGLLASDGQFLETDDPVRDTENYYSLLSNASYSNLRSNFSVTATKSCK